METNTQNIKYPKSIGFIIVNEFCERFSFYGIRAILTLFLTQKLLYSKSDATKIYHGFNILVYFFPIIGGMLADHKFGRFKTIVYLSVIYALGNLLLSISAINYERTFTHIGLLLIAIGSGGIKPCVSAFGGDQFKLPQQEKQLIKYFSMFYFTINAGSVLSTCITPILKSDVQCFGSEDCYSLGFGVPVILMIIAIIIFVSGKRLYIFKRRTKGVFLKCVARAIIVKFKSKNSKEVHWLDRVKDEFKIEDIKAIKSALNVMYLFIPIPVFWALFDQQGSRWTMQATNMNGNLGFTTMKPDQMLFLNPLLILALLPLFQTVIYPALLKTGLKLKPLNKMIIGGLLAASAFIASGLVEMQIEKTLPVLDTAPKIGYSNLRLYNGHNCDLNITLINLNENFLLKQMDVYEKNNILVNESLTINYKLDALNCTSTIEQEGAFNVYEGQEMWYFISDKIEMYNNSNTYTKKTPKVNVMRFSKINKNIFFIDPKNNNSIEIASRISYEINPSTYDMVLDDTVLERNIILQSNGVYAIIDNEKTIISIVQFVEVKKPKSVHMMWLLPQYILITMGEVMFSVTGLEFAFTQAPDSMKSVLTAGWLLTTSFGNLIVILVNELYQSEHNSTEHFIFAALMIIDMVIFWLMTLRYKYVEHDSKNDNDNENEQ